MKLLAGTSGYSFNEWKGTFYPPELKSDQLLGRAGTSITGAMGFRHVNRSDLAE